MKKRSILLILTLIIVTVVQISAPAEAAGMDDDFRNCFDSKNGNADCDTIMSECWNLLNSRLGELTNSEGACTTNCYNQYTYAPDSLECMHTQCGGEISLWLGSLWVKSSGAGNYNSGEVSNAMDSLAESFRPQCKAFESQPQQPPFDQEALDKAINDAKQKIDAQNAELEKEIEELKAENERIAAGIKDLEQSNTEGRNNFQAVQADLRNNRVFDNLLDRARQHLGRDLTAEEMHAFENGVAVWKGSATDVPVDTPSEVHFPKEAPIKKIVASRDTAKMDITLTVIDPAILKKAPPTPEEEKNRFSRDYAPGSPDYPIPDVKPKPKESFYKFFRVDVKTVTEEVIQQDEEEAEVKRLDTKIQGTFFFDIPKTDAYGRTILLQRYDEERQAFIPKETFCSGIGIDYACESDPPISGYYAIILEERGSVPQGIAWLLVCAGWIGIIYLHARSKGLLGHFKSSGFGGKIAALRQIKFRTLVFRLGALYLGIYLSILFIITSFINGTATELGPVLLIFVSLFTGAILGMVIGVVTWFLIWILSRIFTV